MPGSILLIAAFAALAPVEAGGRMTLADDSIRTEEEAVALASDGDLKKYLADHTVVFVGGFLNEYVRHRLTGNYFRHNMAALRDVVPDVRVSRIFPPSSRGMSENTAFLREALIEAWERGGRRPLAVVGHSKGGAETLLTVLRDPDLVLDGMIDDVVLLQSCVGGSWVSDCLADPETCRAPSWLMRLAGRWIRKNYPDGLLSLRRAEAQRLMTGAATGARAALGEERFAALSRKVGYVRAVSPAEGVSRRMRAASRFLADAGFVLNDGMVALEDQRLEGVGSDLGEILSAAHADLVCSGVGVSKRSRRFRAAFTRLLFKALAVRDSGVPSGASPTSRPPAAPSAPDRRSPP